MKVPLPKEKYLQKIEVGDNSIEIKFKKRKKVALLFISINEQYWPYLAQVIRDCKKQFLTSHKVDYFIWTDYNEDSKKKQYEDLDTIYKSYQDAPENQKTNAIVPLANQLINTIRLYDVFYPIQIKVIIEQLQKTGIAFKRDAGNYWLESVRPITDTDANLFYEIIRGIIARSQADMDEALKGAIINDTGAAPWPAPTKYRYHLFTQQDEQLKKYDYLFYLDADMRVVDRIGDEILGDGLTAAEHPMYSVRKEYIPPYEPNENSTAYIKRPGKVVNENGIQRFKPYYIAGGFQGGIAKSFLAAMFKMKKNIDKDDLNNYTAIWNDETHWNKYVFDLYKGHLIVLGPEYIYPDSLIEKYYEPLWGKKYEPKIITLTKPFTLSSQGAEDINKFIEGR